MVNHERYSSTYSSESSPYNFREYESPNEEDSEVAEKEEPKEDPL